MASRFRPNAKDRTEGKTDGLSDVMLENAGEASEFLKPLTHPLRLVILCRLLEGEANVGELEDVSGFPQAVVSKQLANLRAAGLVDFRRDGREIYYSMSHARTRRILLVLYDEFCEECR